MGQPLLIPIAPCVMLITNTVFGCLHVGAPMFTMMYIAVFDCIVIALPLPSPLPCPFPLLSSCLLEVLEVAWASRIIQPGVDGRKEKERIANVTGMSYSKVHEWFRNRRKKEKLVILRKKGLAPTPSKKWSPLTRQQSGSSSSSDLSLRLETANLESSAQGAVSATTSEVPSDLSAP